MIGFKNMEFYNLPNGEVEVRPSDESTFTYKEKHTMLTDTILAYVEEFYPEAYEGLCKEYARLSENRIAYRFRMVRRFLRCNFGSLDSIPDIDHNGKLNFEEVNCPRIGECEYHNVICRPSFNANLTDRETEVMRLLYEGLKISDIALKLILSTHTIETHKANALRKLGLRSFTDFILYANRHNMFQ